MVAVAIVGHCGLATATDNLVLQLAKQPVVAIIRRAPRCSRFHPVNLRLRPALHCYLDVAAVVVG